MTNCGSPETRCRRPPSFGMLKSPVTGQPGIGSRLPSKRIALSRQAGELRARNPRILQELELTQNISVETDEVQSAFLIVLRCRRERSRRWQIGAVFAATPENAMIANGGHEIVSKALRAEA